jgi:EAL domain-containing protein (putative c-di-GMP-specific phosphodiesterase class I)/GGDEF domain-containing protein
MLLAVAVGVAWVAGDGDVLRASAAFVAAAAALGAVAFARRRHALPAPADAPRQPRTHDLVAPAPSPSPRHAAADLDGLTGALTRAAFVGRFTAWLAGDGPGGSLLIVRLADLAGLNHALGRDGADRALRLIGELLLAYPERVRDCLVGRLNGGDFALCLPTPGLAAETAATLADTLRQALAPFGAGVQVHVGAVEFGRGAHASALLASVDLALAHAEAEGDVVVDAATASPAPGGEGAWRRQLAAALDDGRGVLDASPVLDARRRLVHLDAPLRLQWQPQGGHDAASRWLPLATRCRLTPQADRLALALALDAIARDGVPRAVRVAPASLADGDFVAGVLQMLHERSQRARHLWLELPERAAVELFDTVQRFASLVRPLGVRFGLGHGGVRLHRLERVEELGLDYLRLDAALCARAANSAAARDAVRAAALLLHTLSVQVLAEGVVDDADAAVLFEAGVDAVGGPWAGRQQR